MTKKTNGGPMRSLTRRVLARLTGEQTTTQAAPVERGRAGYTIWQRYWAALLNRPLPPRDRQTP
jgi:hypothetical protein